MLKFNFLTIVACLLLSGVAVSQKTEDQIEAEKNGKSQGDLVLKVRNPPVSASDTLTITGIGAVSFIVSNTSDGTANTYRQSQKIVLPLVSSSKNNKYQLVFYGQYDNVAYAVAKEEEKTTIYYPAYMFGEIKQKLEQSLSQKKKVELRVTIKKDGFREGILVF